MTSEATTGWQIHAASRPVCAELFGKAAGELSTSEGRRALRFEPGSRFGQAVRCSAVARWLRTNALRPPYLELTRDGRSLPFSQYTASRTVARVSYPGYVAADGLFAGIAQGASVVLNAVEEWHAPLREACDDLADATRCRVQAVVFVTPPGARCLPPHRDDADVVVLQVHGSKHWQLWQWMPWRERPAPECAELPPVLEHTLHAGDALYVPMGTPHSAVASAAGSIHLTLTLRPPRVRDALELALAQALAPVSPYAFLVGDGQARSAGLERALRALLDRIRETDAAELLERAENAARCRRPERIAAPAWLRDEPSAIVLDPGVAGRAGAER